MSEEKRNVGGRWLAPGENPFQEVSRANAQRRQELIDAGRKRNEEWSKLMNQRAPRRFPNR